MASWALFIAAAALGGTVTVAPAAAPAGPVAAPPAVQPTHGPPPSSCVADHAAIARPEVALLGETIGVTLTARFVCPGEPNYVHIVLVLDASASMAGPPNRELKGSARDLVRALGLGNDPGTRAGVVEFDSTARAILQLTSDESRVLDAVDRVGASGGARIDAGILEGTRVLRRGRGAHRRGPDAIVVMSGGRDDAGCSPAARAAAKARGEGILMVSICVGRDCDEVCMRRIASSPRYFFRADQANGLRDVFQGVRSVRNVAIRRLIVTHVLASDVQYASPGAQPTPSASDPRGRWCRWETDYVPREGITLGLRVRPLRPGRLAAGGVARGWAQDTEGRTLEWEFESPVVTVLQARAAPTAPSAAPTTTPSASPTASPTPRTTAAHTPTDGGIAYLPWADRRRGAGP